VGFCVNIRLPSTMDSFSYGVCSFPLALMKVSSSMCHDVSTLNYRTEAQNVKWQQLLSLHQCVSQIL
jgi:hypothetical protein